MRIRRLIALVFLFSAFDYSTMGLAWPQVVDHDPIPATLHVEVDARIDADDLAELAVDDLLESRTIVNVDSKALGPTCRSCSFTMAVDPESGTALVLSREARETWEATFVHVDGDMIRTALSDMVWPLDLLPAGDDRFYVFGYLPLALGATPGRLGIYSLSVDQPIRHEITLTLNSWALLPPLGFELDRKRGDPDRLAGRSDESACRLV